jgi:3-dehydrosphinganine reductase
MDEAALRNLSVNTSCSYTLIIVIYHFQVKPYNISVTLCMPPDTDTPGYANEEKTKPMETRLISQSSGLMSPASVAKQLMEDTLVSAV